MTWGKYLKNTTHISKEVGVTRKTVYNWINNDKVPPERFKKLKSVLKKLGYDLIETKMRELNERIK